MDQKSQNFIKSYFIGLFGHKNGDEKNPQLSGNKFEVRKVV